MVVILLVEDVDVVRMVLRRMLAKGGHSVIEARNTAEARAALAEGRCQVVVTDLWMPDGDGLDLIREIKAVRAAMPVIAVTGGTPRAPAEFSLEAAGRAGADRILLKPVAKEELLSAVAAVVAECTEETEKTP